MFQGASKITHLKERHLEGIVTMRLRMLTHHMKYIDKLLLADVFCGAGENTIDGNVIDGSPLAIMNGLQDACKGGFRPHSDKVLVQISDIRPEAAASATQILNDKYSHGPDLFAHNSYAGLVEAFESDAAARIDDLHERLRRRENDRLFLFIDPNGPRALPYPELMALLSDTNVADRVDVVVNISATALKRLNSSAVAQVNVQDWIGRFDNLFATVLNVKSEAWIRKPVPSDPFQWCLLVYWSPPFPHWDWRKEGFTQISSRDGQQALTHYSTRRAG